MEPSRRCKFIFALLAMMSTVTLAVRTAKHVDEMENDAVAELHQNRTEFWSKTSHCILKNGEKCVSQSGLSRKTVKLHCEGRAPIKDGGCKSVGFSCMVAKEGNVHFYTKKHKNCIGNGAGSVIRSPLENFNLKAWWENVNNNGN
eukprot:TRINITY_DN3651_c0_g1_i2.p1 TRINITY_DN3651_c0_g1~~TRINITY_DN3651_c0_g1_i2.p1  ORF type:complete len:145 (-),score=11.78 TRINITY_DN3651_c0_g1_i2:104-538(-)